VKRRVTMWHKEKNNRVKRKVTTQREKQSMRRVEHEKRIAKCEEKEKGKSGA